MQQTTDINTNILEIRDLRVRFRTDEGEIEAVRGVNLDLPRNRTLALLGESGCGKSVTAQAILGLVDAPGRVANGEILYRARPEEGQAAIDLARLDPNGEQLRKLRGNEIAMIFQEPRASLTPVYTIGEQIIESILAHRGGSATQARKRAIELLGEVGIPVPERRVDEYPHQLSGGMCQRAMIAMALACQPRLLIADEPTTALDVTIQAQVLDLLRRLQKSHDMSILLITHDMGVVADMADEVAVMYLGRIVERGPVERIFSDPRHPYTRGLFASIPSAAASVNGRLASIAGSVPEYTRIPEGCPFRGRCPEEMVICGFSPRLQAIQTDHEVACWLYQEDKALDGIND